MVHSVSEGVGTSDGVYGGRVSTESGPWCLLCGKVDMGARVGMEGVSCAGLVVCGGPAARNLLGHPMGKYESGDTHCVKKSLQRIP